MVAVFLTFVVLYFGRITLGEALGERCGVLGLGGVVGTAWGCCNLPVAPPSQATWGCTSSTSSPWCSAPGFTGDSGGKGWPPPDPGNQVRADGLHRRDPPAWWGLPPPPPSSPLPPQRCLRMPKSQSPQAQTAGTTVRHSGGLGAGSALSLGVPGTPGCCTGDWALPGQGDLPRVMLEGRGGSGGEVGTPHSAQPPWPLSAEEYRPLLPSRETSLRILTAALSPLDYGKWRRKPWYWRLFKVLKVIGGDTSREDPLHGVSPSPLAPGAASPLGFAMGTVGGGRVVGLPSWGVSCPCLRPFLPGARGAGAAAHRPRRGPRQG